MKIYQYILRVKDQASSTLNRVTNSIRRADGQTSRLSRNVRRTNRDMYDMRDASRSLARFIGPAVLGAALVFGAKKASALAAEMEQTQMSFQVMVGSAQKARSLLGDITEMANVTPFTRMELAKNARLMLNFGIANEKVLPTLKMIGDVSGGNRDRMDHLALAYSQVQAAGRLMGQDLLQMINAGFNPLQTISEKTGVSMGELKKQMEKGAISAEHVERAFRLATSEGGKFFNMMDRQSRTFEGRMSTLRDKFETWATSMGESINTFLSPFLDKAITKIDTMIDKVGMLRNDTNKQRDSFKNLNTTILPMIERYEALAKLNQLNSKEAIGLRQQIGEAIPSAALIGRKGEIKSIGVAQAREYIKLQGDMFLSKSAAAMTKIEAELKRIDTQTEQVQTALAANRLDPGRFDAGSGLSKLQQLQEERLKYEGQLQQLRMDRSLAFIRKQSGPTATGNPFDDIVKSAGGSSSSDDEERVGVSRITGGGKQPITINIDEIVGIQNLNVKNVQEGVRDMEKVVLESILRAVNSANYADAQ